MASTLKVDQIETPSGVGSISFAQPISGDGSQLTGVGLNIANVVAGDVLYYNGTEWTRLPKGPAAQVLKMNAGATAPEWGADATGSGGISEPAGSAAGDILYYNGTEYTRLAKGTAGQQLAINAGATAPEWITASSGGAWTLIGTAEASSSASLTITGIDSTYDTYAVAGSSLAPANDTVQLHMRFGDSGGIDSGNDYSTIRFEVRANSTGFLDSVDQNYSVIEVARSSVRNGSGEGCGFFGYLLQPQDGINPSITGQYTTLGEAGGGDVFASGQFGGWRNSNIAIDRVQIFFSSGNIASGRFTIWGISHT